MSEALWFYAAVHGAAFYRAMFVFTRTRKPLRLGFAWAFVAWVAAIGAFVAAS